ncbi:diguanylate cyclase [Nitrogeniibacter mangrovi]|uniref:Diguanylate cyclase n=1 Tax=Nitrogeniibacter mangrovi TaxID=2016596 RepID=A0A6C1B028_9RHOO|nr:diguanylate cyclase [Nitrogeniibacter mangrovi]QID16733.1 diguanylate cyclase [Nitrogeniibacter mangrovi]
MNARVPGFVWRIVAGYALVAVLWILVSDEIVAWVAADLAEATWISGVKGVGFVLVTAGLLYGVLRRFWRKVMLHGTRGREATARYRALFEHGNDAMLVIAEGDERILEANRAAGLLYGPGKQALVGRRFSDFQVAAPPEGGDEAVPAGTIWHRKAGGLRFPVEVATTALTWDGEPVRLVIVRDVSGALAQKVTLDRLAHRDALTGLPNRQVLADHQRLAMAHAQRTGSLLGVCFLDLDGFKAVNDSFGHEAGDELLRQIARRIKAQLRAGDTVVRLGGDEFVLLLVDLDALAECEGILMRVLTAIAQPVALDGHQARVTASIGVAVYPNDGLGADRLLRDADEAMYRAKAAGKNRIAFFNAILERRAKVREELLDRVTRAMNEAQLTLHYQPIVSMGSGRVLAVEALLRWAHPVLGVLPASEFLPFVNDGRVALDVDLFVLACARADMAQWRTGGCEPALHVNLFAHASHLPRLVDAIAALAGDLPAQALTVEVDSANLMHGAEVSGTLLSACHALGVRVALDGVVAGSDSIHAMVTGTFDEIKIAPGLMGLGPGASGLPPLVRAHLDLAAVAGRHLVAKELGFPEHLPLLAAAGCPAVQGFAVSKPVAAAEVPALLTRQFAWTGIGSGDSNGWI